MTTEVDIGEEALKEGAALYKAAAGSVAVTIVSGFASAVTLPPGYAAAATGFAAIIGMAVIAREKAAFDEMHELDAFTYPFRARSDAAFRWGLVAAVAFVLYAALAGSANWLAFVPLFAFSLFLNRAVVTWTKVRLIRRWMRRVYAEADDDTKETLRGVMGAFGEGAGPAGEDEERRLRETQARQQLEHGAEERWPDERSGDKASRPIAMLSRTGTVATLAGRYVDPFRFWIITGPTEVLLYAFEGTTAGQIRNVAAELMRLGISRGKAVAVIPEWRDQFSAEARATLDGLGWPVLDEELLSRAEARTWRTTDASGQDASSLTTDVPHG